jgi:putative DNA primase/helicase
MTDQSKRPRESGLDPYRLARRFAGKLQVRFWRDEFWVWQPTLYRYRRVTERDLRARVAALLKQEIDAKSLTQGGYAAHVTVARVNNILAALKGHVLVEGSVDMPMWLEGSGPQMLAFQNGLVSVDEALGDVSAPTIQPHSPDWFNDSVFPFAFDLVAEAPLWEAFLDQVLEGDPERIALIQELFGYCLVPGNWLHKFFLFEGQGANGKSVALKMLEAMLGRENISSVPLGLFGERFQLVSTIGKLANIAPEADSSDKPHIGMLKAFTAGDTITIDRKNLTSVQVVPTAKLVIAANSRPTFVDRSEGLWRRLVPVPFNVTIPEDKQDKRLTEKLAKELPGIFNWALKGLKRLNEQGRFTESTLVKAATEEYKLECNPVRQFLAEVGLQADPSGERFVEVNNLYGGYALWSKANGFQPLNASNFGKELRKSFPKVKRTQRTALGHRMSVYLGVAYPLAVREEADPEVIARLTPGAFGRAA